MEGDNLYNMEKDIDLVQQTNWIGFFENLIMSYPTKCHYNSFGKNSENESFGFDDVWLEKRKKEVTSMWLLKMKSYEKYF